MSLRTVEDSLVALQYPQVPHYIMGGYGGYGMCGSCGYSGCGSCGYGELLTATLLSVGIPALITAGAGLGAKGISSRSQRKQAEYQAQKQAELQQAQMQIDAQLQAQQAQTRAKVMQAIPIGIGILGSMVVVAQIAKKRR